MATDLFNRYIWLVDTIYRAGHITLGDISRKWQRNEMSGGKPLPERTFHHHKDAIQEIFDINIECDKKNGHTYYIENQEDMECGGVRSWLLNTFAVNNLINESHHLKRRILFEKIPSGQRFLAPLIEAMRDGKVVKIRYQGFWNSELKEYTLAPYCVKVFKQRWYVIGSNAEHDGELRTFALDRIHEVVTTEDIFTLPKTFDGEAYFSNNFGIIVESDVKPCVVRLKVYGKQVLYFRSLPLHSSQKEEETKDEYSVFSYFIAPTFDFKQEILLHGATVEVFSPVWFRDDVADEIRAVNQLYNKRT